MNYTLPQPTMVHVDAQMYSTPCYTAAQMHEAYQVGQRDMREAAAKECLSLNVYGNIFHKRLQDATLKDVAAAISALPIGEME